MLPFFTSLIYLLAVFAGMPLIGVACGYMLNRVFYYDPAQFASRKTYLLRYGAVSMMLGGFVSPILVLLLTLSQWLSGLVLDISIVMGVDPFISIQNIAGTKLVLLLSIAYVSCIFTYCAIGIWRSRAIRPATAATPPSNPNPNP